MAVAKILPDNPYIIGRPIYEPEYFYGREDLFAFIEDNLKKEAKIILLHGQRRIGKSSVLSQIPNFVKLENFEFVRLSLEGKSQKSLNEVLYEFSLDIQNHLTERLEVSEKLIIVPLKKVFQADVTVFTQSFLPQVYQVLGGKNLVLLLDEFDVMGDPQEDAAIKHLFPYLNEILSEQEKLYILPVIGRRLDDLPKLLYLFKEAPHQEVGLLKRSSAERLIIEPAKRFLEYEIAAIEAILKLSAGHPYFTQIICFALFGQAREQQKWTVTQEDVETIVERAIEFAEGGLSWFYDSLSVPERMVFLAVAELQEKFHSDYYALVSYFLGNPLTLLQKKYDVSLRSFLIEAQRQLLKWGFLKEPQNLNSCPTITVDLVRLWLNKRHLISQEVSTLKQELKQLTASSEKVIGGRYALISKLAEGGFSQTYLADDSMKLQARCIVKQLNPLHLNPEAINIARDLFKREAKVLSQLKHPQIPRFIDYLEEDEEFFIVREYVEGKPLTYELLKPLSENEVLEILVQILVILDFIHSKDIIHRDIKPSNIIRRSADNKLVLIDFGAVEQISTPTDNYQITTAIIGTPSYMPPEQLSGRPRFNSDIYALGMVGIQALTGISPAELPRDFETDQILWNDFATEINPRVANILDKMVSFDFTSRYQSVTEVLRDIRELTTNYRIAFLKNFQIRQNTVSMPTVPMPASSPPQITLQNIIGLSLLITLIFNGVVFAPKFVSWVEQFIKNQQEQNLIKQ